jgi:hypothetical protein
MNNRDDVQAEVLQMIKVILRPGESAKKGDFKIAYDIVRANAIADTIAWKQRWITIE